VTYLLDVNLLIAFCDPFHAHHQLAHQWFAAEKRRAWATCPLTENGFVRITSGSAYPGGHGTVIEQLEQLRRSCQQEGHAFWPDDLSLRDKEIWSIQYSVNPHHLTDLYLLALAVKHGAKLASFDQRIPVHLLRGGKGALHLVKS